jgi:branched-chain amino acid transport system substrate-binding protein
MKNKAFKSLAAIVSLLMILSGCNSGNTTEQPGVRVVRIGSILPLTGPVAAYGNYAKQGQLKAIDDLNKLQADIRFELALEDGKSEGKEAVTAYQKLRSEGVDIITAGSSAMCMPVLPLAVKDRVLYFPSASHPEINRVVSPLVFRHFVTAAQEAPLILSAIDSSGRGKTVLVTVNDEFGKGYAAKVDELKGQYRGVDIAMATTAERTETDFTVLVQKIRQIQPDNVIIVSYGRSAGSLVNKLREQKFDGNIYVSFSYLLTEADKVALSNTGIQAVTMDAGNMDVKEASDYGTVYLIGKSVIDTKTADVAALAAHLTNMGTFDANGISMTIQPNHDILPKVKLVALR